MMRIKTPYIILFLCFVVLGVYYPSLFAPYSSVDDTRLVNSLLNVETFSFKKIFFATGKGQYFRPLLRFTFHLDRFAWGLEESFMHLENILLHMFNVILVFFITFKVYVASIERKKLVAAIAALVFALHPINTESVNWISGRSDVLAGFFILLSLLFLLRALDADRRWSGAMGALFFFMGCMAKETAIFFLPGALFLVLVFPSTTPEIASDGRRRGRWFAGAVFTIAPSLYLMLRHMVFTHGDKGVKLAVRHAIGDPGELGHKLYTILKVAGFYMVKIFMPLPLNFGIVTVSSWYIIPGVCLVLISLYLCWRRDMIAALFLTSICVGSSALIIAIAKMSWTPVAERYMYIPCALFCAAGAVVAANLIKRHNLKIAGSFVLIVILSVFAFATVDRNILWQDNLALAQDTARKSPWFGAAKNDMAIELLKRGKKEEALKIFHENDIEKFQAASLNKVVVLIETGKLNEARSFLRERLKDQVPYRDQILKRLISVDEMIRDKSSEAAVRESMNLEVLELLEDLHRITHDPFCYYRMGRIALALGRKGDAGDFFAKAWKDAPEGAYYKAPAGKLARNLLSSSKGMAEEKKGL